jgi:hypothetical protein
MTTAEVVSSEIRNGRYRTGFCVDCGRRPCSADRPRCNPCHSIHANPMSRQEIRQEMSDD